MKNLRIQILRIYYSITVGIGGFLFTVLITIFFGGRLLEPPEQGHAFFSPQEANLFLLAILLGLVVAIAAGVKYFIDFSKSK